MTTIAVIGATGTVGCRVVSRLEDRGDAVVPIARARGIDIVSGVGLSEALRGVEVVVDVSNPTAIGADSDISDALTSAARNVVGACISNHVQRLVVLTNAGIDHAAFDEIPYYLAKRAAKDIVLNSQVPARMVKSTHFYEFAMNPAAVMCNDHEVIVQDWLIQPIAADTVADVLVAAALAQTRLPRTITGPHAIRLPQLTSKLLAVQGDRRRVRTEKPGVPALAEGALLAPGDAIVLGPDMDTWLRYPPLTGRGGAQSGDSVPV